MNIIPGISPSCFIAPGAHIIGKVRLGEKTSVWYNAVLRGDVAKISIGKGSNIQDNCTLHCSHGRELVIGDYVTVGHNSVLHSCTIGNHSLIGMGAVVLSDAVIGRDCLIAAGSLVTPRIRIPDGSLVAGSPAKVKRALSQEEIGKLKENAENYIALSQQYLDNPDMV